MENSDQIVKILILLLIVVIVFLFVMISVAAIIYLRNRMKKQNEEESEEEQEQAKGKKQILGLNKQSIHNFMEFDSIDDNMIIQNNGKRFLMVIECQGINYDLMSGMEKTAVEEGFVQFLNTLRHPIQIYVQTRSVNLEESIASYKERVRKIEDKLIRMQSQYEQMVEAETYSREELEKAYYELTKQNNLYDYAKDVVRDTEKMSLNNNILNKKYYIVVPYYASELAMNNLDKEETKNLAFSEIYTRAQALISSISACGVKARILRSYELVELLYMAYNRDEAEVFGIDKALRAGYDELYSTAPDVLEKKMKELNKYIEKKAREKAQEKVDEVATEIEQRIQEKQNNIDEYINEMAKSMIEEDRTYYGDELTTEAINRIDEDKTEKNNKTEEKGGKEDGVVKEAKKRGRKPKSQSNKQ